MIILTEQEPVILPAHMGSYLPNETLGMVFLGYKVVS